tara:strand:+ start:695 stop:985 length:291 start_codon:yes stop_codon:yes gene_type:complete
MKIATECITRERCSVIFTGESMIAEFVLVVSITSPIDNWIYKGHFISCEQAQLYVELSIPEAKATRCLLEDYIYLPEDLKKRTINIHDNCKINRSC